MSIMNMLTKKLKKTLIKANDEGDGGRREQERQVELECNEHKLRLITYPFHFIGKTMTVGALCKVWKDRSGGDAQPPDRNELKKALG